MLLAIGIAFVALFAAAIGYPDCPPGSHDCRPRRRWLPGSMLGAVPPDVGSRVEHLHARHARGLVLAVEASGRFFRARVFGDDASTWSTDVGYLLVVPTWRRDWLLEVVAFRWLRRWWRRRRMRVSITVVRGAS